MQLARERILAEAGDLFLAHGADGVTMRGLAARIGVTPMALYRYFDNREALLQAIVEQGHATFLGYLNRSLGEPTPMERLFESGRQYLAFAVDHPQLYSVLFMEHVPDAVASTEPGSWLDAATFRFLVDRIRECVDAGTLATDDPEELALTVWAHVHGLTSLFLAGKLAVEQRQFEQLYERSILAVVGAFATGAGRRPTAKR